MKNWFISREPREQVILSLAGVALICMMYFLFVWEPLKLSNQNLSLRINEASELQTWLSHVGPELVSLKGNAVNSSSSNRGSVLSIADRSAKASGLGSSVKRMQPDGENMSRVWFENAPFNSLLAWLLQLENQNAIFVTEMNINRETQAGHVKARLTLKR